MVSEINARFARLEPLLDRALELEGEARQRFLAQCEEIHPDLISDLRRALGEDDLLLPSLGALAEDVSKSQITDRRGLRAGPWRLLEKIGQGGMGTVYLAERADGAFDKKAAIKLLRDGNDRFKEQLERERRVLARLDHPGIARLIDGGILQDGQPWLVMELAQGEELDAWLRRVRPSLYRRLEVFLAICEAVSYAHSTLVVHRDLKPGNIRVAADGQVKLLDFGIAKLISPEANLGKTRHVALTPEFAAPEQLAGETITTRTDVYALGALLHLILTGVSPHPKFDGNWVAYIDHINQIDAPQVSQAVVRSEGVAIPAKVLVGDLDAIVRKALRRDPAERYVSVDALAHDVRRYLGDRPVLARPQTWQYRSRKWLYRHWGVAAMLATVVLAISAGFAGVMWKSHQADLERDAAQLEAKRSQAVRDYLALMFRTPTGASPESETSARAVLAGAVDGIEKTFSDDPETRQQVLLTLAEIYLNMGDFLASESLLHRFQRLEDGNSPVMLRARAHVYLATIENRRGQPQKACNEVAKVFPLLRKDIKTHRTVYADALSTRGLCRRTLGESDAAVADYEEALDIFSSQGTSSDFDQAAAHNNLAAVLMQRGQHAEAESHLRLAIDAFSRAGRLHSTDAASALNNLAVSAFNRGDLRAANAWFEQASDTQRAASGESAPLGASLVNRGRVLMLLGDIDTASELLNEGLSLMHRFTGEDSLDSASAHFLMADLMAIQGKKEEALTHVKKAYDTFVTRLSPSHPVSFRMQAGLGQALAIQGKRNEALSHLDAAVEGLAAAGPSMQMHWATALCERAILRSESLPSLAFEDAKQCEALRTQLWGEGHWEALEANLLRASLSPDPVPASIKEATLEALKEALSETSPRVRRAKSWLSQ